MRCEICEQNELKTNEETAMQACLDCAESNGIVPMPPPGRSARPCSCGSLRFIRAIPREHSIDLNLWTTPPHQLSTRMLLTHLPKASGPIELKRGVGRLEVYACTACGRVEWFCSDVDAIPVHPHLMTDLVDYGSGSPYR